LARFPDYTRVWIDVASLVLLGCISLKRMAWSRLWIGASMVLSVAYLVAYRYAA
jgi:hypothetical protein